MFDKSPTVLWGEIQTAVGEAYAATQKGITKWFDDTLFSTLPGADANPKYYDDQLQLPKLLGNGYFADVPKFSDDVLAAFKANMAAQAINSLYIQDKVFIMKVSQKAYGGDDDVCEAFKIMTWCDTSDANNKIAHILARWVHDGGDEINHSHLWEKDWSVWGAYAQGSATKSDGSKSRKVDNKDNLKTYGLSMEIIIKSAVKTQNENGFLYADQNGATVAQIQENPGGIKIEDLIFMNIPVCDIDATLGPDKHIAETYDQSGDNRLIYWGACTCVQMKDKNGASWPTENEEGELYPDSRNGWLDSECRSEGWANN